MSLTEKLTMSKEAHYEIKVAGFLGELYTDRNQEITIANVDTAYTGTVTTLRCTVDQAGLLGIVRRLSNLGLPLISILPIA